MAGELVSALSGLGGVLVGTLITTWSQKRDRADDFRHRIRQAYAEWISAQLSQRRWDQRMADLLLSEREVAHQRPSEPRLVPEWQATMNSLAQELGVTERKVQEGMELCEMAYVKVMLLEHSQERLDRLSKLQEAQAPFSAAVAAAKSGQRLDPVVLDESWKSLALETGKLARHVEASLRSEAKFRWLPRILVS